MPMSAHEVRQALHDLGDLCQLLLERRGPAVRRARAVKGRKRLRRRGQLPTEPVEPVGVT